MNKNRTNRLEKKLSLGIVVLFVLIGCLCITTVALTRTVLVVKENYFETGLVKINLNDGEPVIREDEYIFEPGMTVVKNFFIQNESTDDVYYKLYFDNVDGNLADIIEISILYGNKSLYNGLAQDMTRDLAVAADDVLRVDERRELEIWFYYPPTEGNRGQAQALEFDLCAEAVQTRNNPDKLFE
ncbi:MAG: hypothetical protein IJ391_08360 [Clostridia bacterium]|nr:hypothetical protein [Clostridia bacterium]